MYYYIYKKSPKYDCTQQALFYPVLATVNWVLSDFNKSLFKLKQT